MTLDKTDQKNITEIFGKIIDNKVTPRLERLEKNSKRIELLEKNTKATMEMVAKNTEAITTQGENIQDILSTEERIETKLDASIHRQDNQSVKINQLNRRVLKLETKKV